MTFIHTIDPEQAAGEVREMYQRQQAHFGYLPNYARAFSHRPDVMASWAALQASIRRHVAPRRFELITLAAAQALSSSYCSLAHGKVLAQMFDDETVVAIANGHDVEQLSDEERTMMAFARKVAVAAHRVESGDIEALRGCGLADDEIFDIVAVAAARCFFARVLDGTGALPDAAYRESLDTSMREALTVGRPIAESPLV